MPHLLSLIFLILFVFNHVTNFYHTYTHCIFSAWKIPYQMLLLCKIFQLPHPGLELFSFCDTSDDLPHCALEYNWVHNSFFSSTGYENFDDMAQVFS